MRVKRASAAKRADARSRIEHPPLSSQDSAGRERGRGEKRRNFRDLREESPGVLERRESVELYVKNDESASVKEEQERKNESKREGEEEGRRVRVV